MRSMATEDTLYTVGEVAEALEITVRTLHHWESQGLVTPTERSWSNYRLYTPEDVDRIQHILIYRATGMKLAEIKKLLSGGSSAVEHLRRQRESLIDQRAHLTDMLTAIDELLEKEMTNNKPDLNEIGRIIGDANFAEHQAEAKEQYEGTDDWQISQQRTGNWGAQDWAANKQKFDAVDARLAAAVAGGVAPDSDGAAQLVAEHREVLSEFFPVSYVKHYLISRGYITDPRFTEYYERQQEGLAQWLADAIEHVAAANGVDLENPEWD